MRSRIGVLVRAGILALCAQAVRPQALTSGAPRAVNLETQMPSACVLTKLGQYGTCWILFQSTIFTVNATDSETRLDLDLTTVKSYPGTLLLYARHNAAPTLKEYDFVIGAEQLVLARDGHSSADSLRSGVYYLSPVIRMSMCFACSFQRISAQGEVRAVLASTGTAIGTRRVVDQASMRPATYSGSALAPGSIISVFGTEIGPAAAAGGELGADGATLTTALAGTRVLVDGVPAPLLSATYNQIDAVLPYSTRLTHRFDYSSLGGCFTTPEGSVELQVDNNGALSNVVKIPFVYPAAISVFTFDLSGKGQAAAYNEDGSENSSANPARRGSRVLMLLNAGGRLWPEVRDGQIMGDPPSQLTGRVSVVLLSGDSDWRTVEPESVSGLPGWFSSIVQVSFRVPAGVPTDKPLRVVVQNDVEAMCGTARSQEGVTIAVRP